jgi:hypothetical protein
VRKLSNERIMVQSGCLHVFSVYYPKKKKSEKRQEGRKELQGGTKRQTMKIEKQEREERKEKENQEIDDK